MLQRPLANDSPFCNRWFNSVDYNHIRHHDIIKDQKVTGFTNSNLFINPKPLFVLQQTRCLVIVSPCYCWSLKLANFGIAILSSTLTRIVHHLLIYLFIVLLQGEKAAQGEGHKINCSRGCCHLLLRLRPGYPHPLESWLVEQKAQLIQLLQSYYG